ncbi:MFS transporter [Pikeienuella sp. HZG-20]|uniref:MFS transporter n=1 Tax=Paludibacillus litoralis TaxID=3133267 RepID=UPI0030EECF40
MVSSDASANISTGLDADPETDPVRWRILFVLLVSIFMTLVGVSIVNVALPSIRLGLGASQSDLQWVLSGYALTFGVVLVAAGRAGDIMGRGGLFLVGAGVFTAASVAAGLAPDATWLNIARFVQGIGSGLLNPQGLGMIQHYFRGEARGRAFGYFGAAVGFSVAVGPVLGGFLIELGGPELGWRLTFLVNVPIGATAIVLGLLWFPRPLIKRLPRMGSGLRSLDPVGALLLGLAVLAILFPFVEGGGDAALWLLLPLGFLLVRLWVGWERRYVRLGLSPMVDLKIFSTGSYTNGITIMALYFMGMTSIWVLVALYVQEGGGKTALQSGTFGIPAALLSAYAAYWAGSRVSRLGRKLVIGGLLLALLGLGLSIVVVIMHEAGRVSVWWLMVSLSFVGLAQGMVISPNQTLTLEDVPLDYAGSSGAIMQTGQRIGTAVGIAIITAATFFSLAAASWSAAMIVGFGLISFVIFLALLVSVKDLRERAIRHQPPLLRDPPLHGE